MVSSPIAETMGVAEEVSQRLRHIAWAACAELRVATALNYENATYAPFLCAISIGYFSQHAEISERKKSAYTKQHPFLTLIRTEKTINDELQSVPRNWRDTLEFDVSHFGCRQVRKPAYGVRLAG